MVCVLALYGLTIAQSPYIKVYPASLSTMLNLAGFFAPYYNLVVYTVILLT